MIDSLDARRVWMAMEPLHALVYFAPEAAAAFETLGLDARSLQYFGSRAAALGAASAELVRATFFNFSPRAISTGIPEAWRRATPSAIIEARTAAAGDALRRLLGDDVISSPEMALAATLGRAAAEAITPEGRPLAAAHVALPWPGDAHLVLWQAQTILREFRGDGHVARLVAAELSGCEANVLQAAMGTGMGRELLQGSRQWTDEEWGAAVDRLDARGWTDGDGALTELGRSERQRIEDDTDRLSIAPYTALGADRAEQLRQLCLPWSRAIVAAGTFPFPRQVE